MPKMIVGGRPIKNELKISLIRRGGNTEKIIIIEVVL